MDWELLENILRSRETEGEEEVLLVLAAAIGRQCGVRYHRGGREMLVEINDSLFKGYHDGRDSLQSTP